MARMVSADEARRIMKANFDDSVSWALGNTVVAQAAEIDRLTQAVEYAAAAFDQRDAALAKVEAAERAGAVKAWDEGADFQWEMSSDERSTKDPARNPYRSADL